MERYIHDKLHPTPIAKHRKRDKDAALTPREIEQLRGAAGAIGWCGREVRLDVAATAALLQSAIAKPVVQDLLDANLCIQHLQQTAEAGIKISPIAEAEIRKVLIVDSALDNVDNPKDPDAKRTGHSQQGWIVGFTTSDLNKNNKAPFSIAHYSSGKCPRVVSSSLASETYAMSTGLADLEWTHALFSEMAYTDWDYRRKERQSDPRPHPEDITKYVEQSRNPYWNDPPCLVITDAKSLFDNLDKETPGGKDRRVGLELAAVKESMLLLIGRCRWISHDFNPADALTKRYGKVHLLPCLNLMRSGSYRLTDEKEQLKKRQESKSEKGYVPRPKIRDCRDDPSHMLDSLVAFLACTWSKPLTTPQRLGLVPSFLSSLGNSNVNNPFQYHHNLPQCCA